MAPVDLAQAIELARAALPLFGVDPTTELSLLKNRENFVFALDHAGVRHVLRVHRQGYHSDAELGCELDFVRALHHEGVAVPNFIAAPDGRGFVVVGVDHPAGAHQVDLQLFIENSGNFGDERTAVAGTAALTPEDFEALGHLIAQVHQATEDSATRWPFLATIGTWTDS